MQQRVIVDELNVAGTKFHVQMQRRVIGQRVEQIQRLNLLRGQGWHIRKAARRFDVLALLNGREQVSVPIENRDAKVGQLSGRDFAARATTDNQFYALNPQYSTTLSFAYTQPLLRNRKIDAERRNIKIAKKKLDLSDSQFRQRAIELIANVERAYWDLVFARRDEAIKRESVELAKTQLEHNLRQVAQGTLAPADVISARVEIARRTDEAEAAVETIARAENALKALVSQPSNDELWNTAITPTDQPELSTTAPMPAASAEIIAAT